VQPLQGFSLHWEGRRVPSLHQTAAGAGAGGKVYTPELKDRGGITFLTCSCAPESRVKAEGTRTSLVS